MFPDDPKSTAFPLFESTILNQTVTSITWSPSNDLCVLVYQDNSISLCRATTVSIWTFSDLKSKVTAIAWHPNGQEFVVGCLDGTIYQVSAIKFIPNFILCWPPCDCVSNPADGISSLLWIDYSPDLPTVIVPGFDPTAFDMQSHLPALSMVPPEEPVYVE
ncbi:uncharacterized protein BX664DRAFT_268239 [Halteromyces radiatus]|uniref:uncharacterized protein n=1 Tax=Halteromyces radiatus TaxID=101107 RepID=UPI0022205A47|nr:uncharacterized protein BX664DRAFT_268239 [Halteromyces radiatus]KAI8081314.1 hypothetical protein BX664DRAFT_268239 [Halteromyces radiatus]